MAEAVSPCHLQRRSRGAGSSQPGRGQPQPRSMRPPTQADALPVTKTPGTVSHRPGKDKLGTGSLNPHSINQAPIVKPRKGPQLSHLAATRQAPRANPRGKAAFSSATGQEDELAVASV